MLPIQTILQDTVQIEIQVYKQHCFIFLNYSSDLIVCLGCKYFFPTKELSCFDSKTVDYFKQDFGDGEDLSWDPILCEQTSQ